MKVLVVDDNENLTFLIREMLANEGHDVRTASNGEIAYILYPLFRPDVVITDVEMPLQDGPQLVKLIRLHEPKIRTIYMSGNPSRLWALLEEEKNAQVSILPKPFSKTELVQLVSRQQRDTTRSYHERVSS